MKELIINRQNPQGIIVETNEPSAAPEKDFMKEFFEGLASADTNSIAKIRSLAKEFLEKTEERQ